MTPCLMACRILLPCALLAFTLVSCGDKPVMTLPDREALVGTWECQPYPKRTQQALGKASALGQLVLDQDGSYTATNFPMKHPLRLYESRGHWELLDPTITPSGVCSIQLEGAFLSIRRRGDRLVLHYPIDVLEDYSAEYLKK